MKFINVILQSYFGNRRICRNKITDNRWQIHRPERALRLTIVYLNGAIKRCIDIEIS